MSQKSIPAPSVNVFIPLVILVKPIGTIRSHATKSHMLVSKLHSGTSKQREVEVDLNELLCFGSPTVQSTVQLAHQHV